MIRDQNVNTYLAAAGYLPFVNRVLSVASLNEVQAAPGVADSVWPKVRQTIVARQDGPIFKTTTQA